MVSPPTELGSGDDDDDEPAVGKPAAGAPTTVQVVAVPASGTSGAASVARSPEVVPDFTDEFEILGGEGGEAGAQHKHTVLLVDDEDALRKVMKDLLEREGFVVVEAADGVQALDQVDRIAPDVIVLDLNLPGLDGYGVLSHLRSRPATQSIPVLVLTAKGDEDNEVRVFELGADDFITKPFRARALAARLDSLLGRRSPD